MPTPALTEPEGLVLRTVEGYLLEHSYPPTLEEVARLCGFASRSTAHRHIHNMIRKGYLEGTPGRTLRVVQA